MLTRKGIKPQIKTFEAILKRVTNQNQSTHNVPRYGSTLQQCVAEED